MAFLSKHKRLFLIAGMLVCVTAVLFTLNPGIRPTLLEKTLAYTVIPLQKGVTATRRWVRERFSALTGSNRLLEENKSLRDKINRLEIDLRRLGLADDENKKLSALLAIKQKYAELPMEGAEIIGKDPNDWYDSFNIDKGENHGVYNNMAVLGDGGGLVGVVREAWPNYSKVISLIDSRFSVSVKSARTGDFGVVKGDIKLMQEGLCRMNYIRAEAQIMPGDEIITSSQGSYFPPGILVGTVLLVETNPDGLTKYALIQPAAQINRIETVLVVVKLYGEDESTPVSPEE